MSRWIGLLGVVSVACGGSGHRYPVPDWMDPVATIQGLDGPESVRYDPEQDVWFVGNFNGEPAGDHNGYVARVAADGTMDSLHFMVGTDVTPLDGARGMYIVGDTLWVTDARGVHGFDRHTGEHLAFIDLSRFEPGFLNDIVEGPDSALYVTDTGHNRVYRLAGGTGTIVLEQDALDGPNGITWDATQHRFLIVAWNPGPSTLSWDGGSGLAAIGERGPGRNDGIEVIAAGILLSNQADSSLHLLADGSELPVLRVRGRPADIGVDTRRGRVAVPYVALNRVDIWPLPGPPPSSPAGRQ